MFALGTSPLTLLGQMCQAVAASSSSRLISAPCVLSRNSYFLGLELASSGPEKGVITKGVLSMEVSLEIPKSLHSRASLDNGQILLCFPQSETSLESLNSLESLENGLF